MPQSNDRAQHPDRLACATPDVIPAVMVMWLVTCVALGVMIVIAARHLSV